MLPSVATYEERFCGDIDGPLSPTMSRSARRGPWLPEEDQALLQLVRSQGANNWVRISQQIQHRSPKQCRERYHQNLKPSLKHDPISAQEGEAIERLVQEMGKRWAEIARRLGNRSDNAVKNWWNGSVNRRRRNPAQATTGFKQVGSRLQPVPFSLPLEHNYTPRQRPPYEPNNISSLTSHEPRHYIAPLREDYAVRNRSPIHLTSASLPGTAPTTAFDPRILRSIQSGHSGTGPVSGIPKSTPAIPRLHTSDERPELPPLHSSSLHLHSTDRLNSLMDRPPISPGLSDTSQRHAPSLISDSQSVHSISPGTAATPRPGIFAPSDIRNPNWPDTRGTPQHLSQHQSYKPPLHTDYHTTSTSHMFVDPALSRYRASGPVDDRSKDLRMNVSTLLQ